MNPICLFAVDIATIFHWLALRDIVQETMVKTICRFPVYYPVNQSKDDWNFSKRHQLSYLLLAGLQHRFGKSRCMMTVDMHQGMFICDK